MANNDDNNDNDKRTATTKYAEYSFLAQGGGSRGERERDGQTWAKGREQRCRHIPAETQPDQASLLGMYLPLRIQYVPAAQLSLVQSRCTSSDRYLPRQVPTQVDRYVQLERPDASCRARGSPPLHGRQWPADTPPSFLRAIPSPLFMLHQGDPQVAVEAATNANGFTGG